ncbi:4-hydroxy-tetrahydrodipicolinate reductase [Blattabacterium cuenoti]|uniref:4-hydroxy-tetrahydrodipicolinate reductase n=1 Tax=Blattabacterium cuenoti TaxID=1653831 RepID=UPI00163C2215|nr:4-hydroxy-tetrahydrodipicolinate reductase [Blattabacterium cuenoti]
MNIAIIGYGKMGKYIEKIATNRNHKISFCSDHTPNLSSISLKKIDVAIEFSTPNSALDNIKICIENNIPIVCGTTGWLDNINLIKDVCLKQNSFAFLYSSNFSIGMNLFYIINQKLSKLLYKTKYQDYNIEIDEIHHKNKKDIPSGTALQLAEIIIDNNLKKDWTLEHSTNDKDNIYIRSKRLGNEIGMHKIKYISKIDDIEIMHKAHSRYGFAFGAVIAAEWIQNKNGFFSMQDVLSL